MNKLKRMSAHFPDQFHLLPITDIGGHSFEVNSFMPSNDNCEVYQVYSLILSILRESIKNNRDNHRSIKTGKYNHLRGNRIANDFELFCFGDFHV